MRVAPAEPVLLPGELTQTGHVESLQASKEGDAYDIAILGETDRYIESEVML